MKMIFVSVVRDFAMYERLVRGNPCNAAAEFVAFDNRTDNRTIPERYNSFLDGRGGDEDVWYVFVHEDFEFLEPLEKRLPSLDRNSIYGPCGAAASVPVAGVTLNSDKDGGSFRFVGAPVADGFEVATLDCMCLIVHSSLVARYGLRFDEKLTFDLYAEDFCVAARERHGIPTRICQLRCYHHSYGTIAPRFETQLEYLCGKYAQVEHPYPTTTYRAIGRKDCAERMRGEIEARVARKGSVFWRRKFTHSGKMMYRLLGVPVFQRRLFDSGEWLSANPRNVSLASASAETIHVALGADSRFAPGLLVTAASMAAQAASGVKLVFHVMDSGLSERDRCDLEEVLAEIRPGSEVSYLKIDTALFNGLPPWRGGYSAYERLLLHEALGDVDYIVYSDVDTYWGRDVAELWAMRDDVHSIWAASDALDRDMGKAYFCSGVYLVNLKRLRETGFTAKMTDYAKTNKLTFPDQDILNSVLGPDSVLVSSVWDMQETAEWDGAFSEPCVIHYTRNKPWLKTARSPVSFVSAVWWDFFFAWIKTDRRREVASAYRHGALKAWLYSKPAFVAAYCAMRRLSPLKRRRLADLFLASSPRNRDAFWLRRRRTAHASVASAVASA